MKLTPEQLKQNAAAMIAFAEGKPVEEFDLDWLDSGWQPSPSPGWHCPRFLYRPKPEPRTRPWSKPEDVPINCWIRNYPNPSQQWFVYCVHDEGISYSGGFSGISKSWLSWDELHRYEHSTDRVTWKPCVTEVTE